MKIGTKSVLFGAHQFLIHPFFVAWAWWELYGFPFDLRLWIAFFLHDLGYWGKPNMDGPEGESHPFWAARVMYKWFDGSGPFGVTRMVFNFLFGKKHPVYWHNLCLYHSRFLAKEHDTRYSDLCVADKYSLVLTPAWLYVPMTTATGEIFEYMELADARTEKGEPKYASMNIYSDDRRQWFANVQEYLRRWVAEHRDGKEDTWTPNMKAR